MEYFEIIRATLKTSQLYRGLYSCVPTYNYHKFLVSQINSQ